MDKEQMLLLIYDLADEYIATNYNKNADDISYHLGLKDGIVGFRRYVMYCLENYYHSANNCIIFPQTIGNITYYSKEKLIEWAEKQQALNMQNGIVGTYEGISIGCCENCVHANKSNNHGGDLVCPMWGGVVGLNPNGFCHMWKQKDNVR